MLRKDVSTAYFLLPFFRQQQASSVQSYDANKRSQRVDQKKGSKSIARLQATRVVCIRGLSELQRLLCSRLLRPSSSCLFCLALLYLAFISSKLIIADRGNKGAAQRSRDARSRLLAAFRTVPAHLLQPPSELQTLKDCATLCLFDTDCAINKSMGMQL